MKYFLIIILLPIYVMGQKIDTIIKNDVYKSYFCYKYKEPLYVVYKLYKGGGDCSRAGMNFKNDTKIKTATDADYSHSGYDKGHLVNAEDMANDCRKDELTFRYYNCLPQTGNLNRGIWKQLEEKVRQDSQKDSLLIVCGGIFLKGKIIGNGVYVPDYCFKVTKSLTTGKIIDAWIFTNNESDNTKTATTIKQLEKLGKFKIYF